MTGRTKDYITLAILSALTLIVIWRYYPTLMAVR